MWRSELTMTNRKSYKITMTYTIRPYDDKHCQGCAFYDFSNVMYNQFEKCTLFGVKFLPLDYSDPEKRALRLEECIKLAVEN